MQGCYPIDEHTERRRLYRAVLYVWRYVSVGPHTCDSDISQTAVLTPDVFQLKQNTLISTTSGETFNTNYNTNQQNKNYHVRVHLGPITTYVQILYDL